VETLVRFTLVTGEDGTADDFRFELLDEFAGMTLYDTFLTRDLAVNTTEVFEFVVSLDFCEFSSFRLTKLTGADNYDDHWFLAELFFEADGEMVFFDRVADRTVTADQDSYMGGYTRTAQYSERCD